MRNRAEDMRALEVDKTLKNMDHLSSEDKEAIQQLTQSLVNKILHKPTINLKKKTQLNIHLTYGLTKFQHFVQR